MKDNLLLTGTIGIADIPFITNYDEVKKRLSFRLNNKERLLTYSSMSSWHSSRSRSPSSADGKSAETSTMAEAFLFSGMPTAGDEDPELHETVDEIRLILNAHMNGIRAAVKRYLDDDDQDAFFLSLLPVHLRIWYEAYSPYWLKYCHPVSECDDDAGFTYYNDLIDMYWVGKWQEWKRKDKWEVMIMLPPTKGLVLLQYREEMMRLDG